MKGRKRKSRFSSSSSSCETEIDSSSLSNSKIQTGQGKFMMTFKETAQNDGDNLLHNAVLLLSPEHVRVKVMKELLQIQSPILRARLSDAAAAASRKVHRKTRDGEEKLPVFYFEDLEVEPFHNFLKYLYGTETTWNWSMLNVSENGNVVSSVLALRCLAKKLGVTALITEINIYLESLLTSSDSKGPDMNGRMLCQIYEGVKNLEIKNLQKKSLEIILKSPMAAFQNVEDYKILKVESFMEILKADELAIESELELFLIVLRWGEAQKVEIKGQDNVDLIKRLVPFIRFTLMTLDQFMEHVHPTQLLDDQTLGRIFPVLYWKCHQNKIPENFVIDIKTETPRLYFKEEIVLEKLPFSSKIFEKIIDYLSPKEVMRSRLISRQFCKQIEHHVPLVIVLDDKLLNKIEQDYLQKTDKLKHPFSRILVFIEKFEQANSDRALRFIESCKFVEVDDTENELFLQLKIDTLTHHLVLINFLKEVMASAPSLKISLKISRISSNESKWNSNQHRKYRHSSSSSSFESDETEDEILKRRVLNTNLAKKSVPLSFYQVTSIQMEHLSRRVELESLVEMTRTCPNLARISIGNFTQRTKTEDPMETDNLVKFLKVANLDGLEVSLANLGNTWLTKQFFHNMRHTREAILKRINLEYDDRTRTLELINIFSDDLEEIYDLEIRPTAPIKYLPPKTTFSRLTTLSINCSVQWLLFILIKTPALEKLFWSEVRMLDKSKDWNCLDWVEDDQVVKEVAGNSKIRLNNLNRIVISIKRKEHFQLFTFLAAVSPKVKGIGFEIVENGGSSGGLKLAGKMWKMFKAFPNIEQLELCENREVALQALTGLRESQLKNEYKNPNYLDRLPYIGDLKELRVLNLGLMDYQEEAAKWKWQVNFAIFTHGIGHLIKLEKIILPPMEFHGVKKILGFLAANMKTVTHVACQVYARERSSEGSMTDEDFVELKELFEHFFSKLEAVLVLGDDGHHYTIWI